MKKFICWLLDHDYDDDDDESPRRVGDTVYTFCRRCGKHLTYTVSGQGE